MATQSTIAVYQKENGGFFVEPPAVVIGPTRRLGVINPTDGEVKVTIGTQPPLVVPPHTQNSLTIGIKTLPTIPGPTKGWVQFGYSVSVNVRGTVRQAFGNSDPVIIIDR